MSVLKPMRSPTLNRPLARTLGVFGYFPFTERGGRVLQNLAGPQHGTLSSDPPAWVAGTLGPGLYAAENTGRGVRISGGGKFTEDLTDVTLAVRVRLEPPSGGFTNRQLIILGDYSSQWAARLYTDFWGGGMYPIGFMIVASGAGHEAFISAPPPFHGLDISIVGARRGTDLRLYLNGMEVAASSCPSSILRSHPSDDSSLMNTATPGAGPTMPGTMYEAIFADRGWSPEQVRQWHEKPFALWAPAPEVWGPLLAGGGAALQQTLSEILGLTDTRTAATAKAATELLSLTDTRAAGAALACLEALTLADTRTAGAGAVRAESLALAEALTRAVSASLGEALGLSDAANGYLAGNLSQTLAESLILTDTRAAGLAKAAAEILGLTDLRAAGLGKSAAELLALADQRAVGLGKAVSEALLLTDARFAGLARQVAESLSLSDAAAGEIVGAILVVLTRWRPESGRRARPDLGRRHRRLK